jgi:hypothetical protein
MGEDKRCLRQRRRWQAFIRSGCRNSIFFQRSFSPQGAVRLNPNGTRGLC